MAEAIRIEIPIETIDNTDPALSSIIERLEKLDKAAEKAKNGVKGMGQSSSVNQTSQLGSAADKAGSSFNKAGRYVSAFDRAMGSAGSSARAAQRHVSAFDKVAEGSRRSLASLVKEKYEVLIQAKDLVSPAVSQIASAVKGVTGKIGSGLGSMAKGAAGFVTAPLRSVGRMVTSPLAMLGGGVAVGAGVKDAVQTYASFSSAMSQVQAVSGATGEAFTQLENKAQQMGASTKFTATQAAEAFNYMGMAGWKPQQMMSGIEGIMNLAAASGEDLASTSDIVTDSLTAFGMQAKDSTHFADVLAAAAAGSNTSVGLMGETFKYAGTMAGSLGYDIADVALATGLMANAGLKGSMAGTSLNSIMTRLATNTSGAADTIKELGIDFYDSEGNARDFSDVMGELRTATKGMNDEQKTQLANTVAGMEAQKGLLAILNATDKEYGDLSDAVNDADGASKKMADTMLDNLSGSYTLMNSAIDGTKTALGERLSPYLQDFAEWVTGKMPAVTDGINHFMDGFDRKTDQIKEKIGEFTSGDEWQDADLFGKTKIAWDELVAQPFSEWWGGGGKQTMGQKAGEIGLTIGQGLSGGLLTLLGIDVAQGLDEGASIGAKFAQGFMDGFDMSAVKGAVGDTFSGLFSNAMNILPGGAEASLSSWMSAATLAKVGMPLLSLAGKGLKLGSGVFKAIKGGLSGGGVAGTDLAGAVGANVVGGAASGGLFSKIIGKFSIADELAGVGMAKGSGLLGLFGKTGMALGSGATTAGGLAAVGGGAIAGGLIGAGTLISGFGDWHKAYKSKDADEQSTAIASGGLKIGGVAAGAGMGAMIGSVIPVVGTAAGALIGAGIGGLAGTFGASKVEKNYEERKEAAELMEEKSQYALKGSKFATSELKDAFKDAEVSAAEFGQMMQKSVSDKVQDSFGNVKLSLDEIKDTAKQIMLPDGQDKKLNAFSDAAAQAEASLSNVGDAVTSLEKWNWKASLGEQFSDEDKQSYMASVDGLTGGATQFLEDKHFEHSKAMNLLMPAGTPVDMTSGVNAMYADIESKVQSYGDEAKRVAELALEDGEISPDAKIKFTMDGMEMEMSEAEALATLQNGISDQVNQVAQLEADAGFQKIKGKYSGSDLTADSYSQVLAEMGNQAADSIDTYADAYGKGMAQLNLAQEKGYVNSEQYAAQKAVLEAGKQSNFASSGANLEGFGLETVANSFGRELDGILPQIQGNTSEKLGQAMHNAWSEGVDTDNWGIGEGMDLASAVDSLGLEGLDSTTQGAVASMMGEISRNLPEEYKSLFRDGETSEAANKAFEEVMDSLDLSGTGSKLLDGVAEEMGKAGGSKSGKKITEGFEKMAEEAADTMDLAKPAETLIDSLGTAVGEMDFQKSGSGLQEGMVSALASSFESESMDLGKVAEALTTSLGTAMSDIDMDKSGSGLQEGLSTSLAASFEEMDLSSAAEALNAQLGTALGEMDMEESGGGLQEGIATSLTGSFESMDLSSVAEALNSQLGVALGEIDMSESGGGLQEGLATSLAGSMENLDLSAMAEGIGLSLSQSFGEVDMSGVATGISEALSSSLGNMEGGLDMSGIAESVSTSITSAFEGIDFSSISTAIGTGIGSAVAATDLSQATAAAMGLRLRVKGAIDSAFSAPFTTTISVIITANYSLANPTATISFSGGGSGSATVSGSIASNAEGSIVDGPLLSWVGEDGPEAIIPLGAKRRSRGLDLWRQAGRMLGIPGYAEGGLIGAVSSPSAFRGLDNTQNLLFEQGESSSEEWKPAIMPSNEQKEEKENAGGIQINVNMNPRFDIRGSGDSEEILNVLKKNIRSMADDLGDEIAERLADSFSNRPIVV